MASEKPEIKIEVPRTGVRKDVSPLLQDPTMASDAENCIYYDGTIRPRPAVSNQGFGTDFAPAWEKIYTDGDISGWDIWGMVQADDGSLLASCINTAKTDQKFMISVDQGESWEDAAFAHPLSGSGTLKVRWMEIIEGYLFCYGGNDVISDRFTHTPNEYLYRSSMASFPTTMTFTSIGPMEIDNLMGGGGGSYVWFSAIEQDKTVFNYDSESGSIVFSLIPDDGYGIAHWHLKDALTTTTANDVEVIGDEFAGAAIGGLTNTLPAWVNKQWMVWSSFTYAISWPEQVIITRQRLAPFEWNSTSGTYDYDYLGSDWQSFLIYSNGTEPANLGSDDSLIPYSNGPPLDMENGFVLQPLILKTDIGTSYPRKLEFLRFKIDNPDAEEYLLTQPHILSSYDAAGISGEILWYFVYKNARIAGITWNDVTSPDLMVGVTSDNDGKDFKFSAAGGEDMTSQYNKIFMIINEETFEHYAAKYRLHATYDLAFDSIYYSPTSGGSGVYGDVTTVHQMDMDDEDEVVSAGTTKAFIRLDADNNIWERKTANHDETVPGSPATTWVNDGDIPPLSVTEDRAEYVTGTTINGSYGENPWVFRSFEVQGKSVLVGTNGQCRPILYHPDCNGGFARRLGEVPANEAVNDLPLWDADSFPNGYLRTGNLAPIARCIASAAGRLLLGNLVGTSPYGIDTSGFLDPDRGWGLEQTTLLGDTPGPLVSMNEISALSVALYKSDAIYHAIAQTEFMGVAAPFRFELSKIGVAGPCSSASVLKNFDGKHIYLGRDGGVYMYDGVAPIDAGRNVRRMIQDNLNPNGFGKCWGMVDRRRKLVWFFYPSKDGLVNRGIVVSTDQGYPWPAWPVSLPAGWNFATGQDVTFQTDTELGDLRRLGSYGEETLGSFSTGDQHLLMGTQNNLWYSQKWDDDGDYTDDGESIRMMLETGWTTPGELKIYNVDELYHIFSAADPLQEINVMVKAQQIGQNILQSKIQRLWAGKKRRRTRHRIRGAQFKARLEANITRMTNWGGAIMKLTPGGQR